MAVLTTRAGPASPAGTVSRAPRFPLLDPVRAIAALLVLALHAFVWARATETPTLAAPWVSRLDVGVTIFFLLSGFLLYRPFVRARLLGERSPRVGPYARRRVLRIVPAYWLALLVTAIWLGKHEVLDPATGWKYFGFVQIYTSGQLGGLAQAWTLCVEVTFYAFLPLWAWLMRRRDGGRPGTARSEWLALAGLAAFSVLYQAVLEFGAADPTRALTPRGLTYLPGYLDHFAIGMAIAVASVEAVRLGRPPRALAWAERRPWLSWALALVAYVVVCRGIGLTGVGLLGERFTAWQGLGRHQLYALVALGVLLPAVFGDPCEGRLRRWLGHRWLVYLGLISYGIYLWHDTVLEQAFHSRAWELPLHPYLDFLIIGLAGGIALAALSFHFWERPWLRLKRSAGDRQAPPRDPTTHAPMEPAAAK
jgi:peptidoglycan/LPS O-acetylase OafA/YrhL